MYASNPCTIGDRNFIIRADIFALLQEILDKKVMENAGKILNLTEAKGEWSK